MSNAMSLPPSTQRTGLDPVPVHDLTKLSDERSKTLRELLERSHSTLAPLRDPRLMFHSHMPHALGSAYELGASAETLRQYHTAETSTLVPISNRFVRGGITKDNWRDFLNQKPYTVAYTAFFDQEVRARNGDWKKVVEQYLYSGEEPLINGFSGGLAHPFIHLAYAYEFNIAEVATEALSLGSTEYDFLHRYIDRSISDTSTYKATSLDEILTKVRQDKRFDEYFEIPGFTNIFVTMGRGEKYVLEHFNALKIVNPVQTLENFVDTSVLVAISNGNPEAQYDFFLAHVLTVAHALRVLWAHFPVDRRETILREYALWVITVYIAQLRRPLDKGEIDRVELNGRDWSWVVQEASGSEAFLDSHFVKVVRALKVSAETYGEKDGFYLKAAVKYVSEYKGWTGFGNGV